MADLSHRRNDVVASPAACYMKLLSMKESFVISVEKVETSFCVLEVPENQDEFIAKNDKFY